jgi:hypothetical protein
MARKAEAALGGVQAATAEQFIVNAVNAVVFAPVPAPALALVPDPAPAPSPAFVPLPQSPAHHPPRQPSPNQLVTCSVCSEIEQRSTHFNGVYTGCTCVDGQQTCNECKLHWLTNTSSTCPLCRGAITHALVDGVAIEIEHRVQGVSDGYNEMMNEHEVRAMQDAEQEGAVVQNGDFV